MITITRNVRMEFRRGAGSSLEVLYGKVSLTPTILHTVGTSTVLPAPSTFDLINGVAIATNVAPSPAPVGGQVDWAYTFKITDNFGKTWEYMAGVPDGTTEINFNVLPRYFATKPPLFGAGPQGVPGEAATIEIGSVGATPPGSDPAVNNSGTANDAVLNFELPRGEVGPQGVGVPAGGTALQIIRKDAANTTTEWVTADKTLVGLGNVDNTSDANKPVSVAQATAIANSDTLPYATARAIDPPSAYPHGTTTTLGRASEGWGDVGGSTTFTQVTTQRSIGFNGGAIQWLSHYTNPALPISYRVANSDDTWGAHQTVATESWVRTGSGRVRVEEYGAIGDGATDDSNAIEAAINANLTTGKTVVFDSAKNYLVTRTITNVAPAIGDYFDISLDSSSGAPSTITVTGALTGILIRGAIVASTVLTAPTYLQQRAWAVASTAGVVPGSLLQIIGFPSWYYDPRPESTDTRISELQRVSHTSGTTVYTEAPANDGYRPTDGTVTVNVINPIRAKIANIQVNRANPADGSDATIGLRVDLADSSSVCRVTVRNSTGAGISYRNSYSGVVSDCKVFGANNWSQGYGISVPGCSYTLIEKNYIATSRRALDVTSDRQTVSRYVRVISNTYVGGGKSSQGLWFGWNPTTDALESRNGGFGCHGGADTTTFEGNLTMNCVEPYVVRGANPTFINNTHIGRTDVAVFGVAEGGGVAIIQGNRALSGWLGTTKYQFQANARRANAFVKTYDSFVPAQGRLIVSDNYAEVTSVFALFGTVSPPSSALPVYVSIRGNRVGFSDNTAGPGVLLRNPSGTLVNSGIWWTIGPNEYISDTKVTAPKLTENINLNGAKVLDYTTSGPTT